MSNAPSPKIQLRSRNGTRTWLSGMYSPLKYAIRSFASALIGAASPKPAWCASEHSGVAAASPDRREDAQRASPLAKRVAAA